MRNFFSGDLGVALPTSWRHGLSSPLHFFGRWVRSAAPCHWGHLERSKTTLANPTNLVLFFESWIPSCIEATASSDPGIIHKAMTIDPSGTRDRTGSSLLGQMSDCSGLKGVKQLCRPQACQPSIGDHFPPQCINIHLLVPLWVILVWPGANMWLLGRLNCFVGASMSALRTCPAWG